MKTHVISLVLGCLGLLMLQGRSGTAETVDTTICQIHMEPERYHGKMVRLRGAVVHGAHDSGIRDTTCGASVLWAYPDDKEVQPPVGFALKRDRNYRVYSKYLNARAKPKKGTIYIGGPPLLYDVTATFVGQLRVTKSAGLVRDGSGKVVGIDGYGHPMPFSRFLIVVESVSDVVATKRKPPQV